MILWLRRTLVHPDFDHQGFDKISLQALAKDDAAVCYPELADVLLN